MAKDKKELSKAKQLEKENARLRQENVLLKKWQRFLAKEHQNDLGMKHNKKINHIPSRSFRHQKAV